MKKLVYLGLALAFAYGCGADGDSIGTGNSSDPNGSGQGGSLARFALAGDHLYAVNGTRLKVFDISNPENVIHRIDHDIEVNVETAWARDPQTLFIGSTTGMYIYDISSPPQVQYISRYEHVVSCDPVVANDQYAFVTLRSSVENWACNRNVNQLDVLDISNLSSPRLIASHPMEHPIGLGLHGDTLLVCDEGIKVLDATDVQTMNLIEARADIKAVDIIPFGKIMMVVGEDGFAQYRYHNGKLELLSRL